MHFLESNVFVLVGVSLQTGEVQLFPTISYLNVEEICSFFRILHGFTDNYGNKVLILRPVETRQQTQITEGSRCH